MSTPDDRRVRRTRTALLSALRQLLGEKRYQAITVTEILDRADVGRSTFYAHFTDKDALLLSAVDHIAAELESAVRDGDRATLRPLFRHAAEHADLYRVLGRGPGAQLFLRRLTAVVARHLAEPADGDGATGRLGARFRAAGVVGVLTWWLDEEPGLTVDEVTSRVGDLLGPGRVR